MGRKEVNIQNLYVLVGIPGSGKSTWAKNLARKSARILIVNCDTLREMLHGTYKYEIDTECVVEDTARIAIMSVLNRGFDVIVDETNITREKRKKLVDTVMATGIAVKIIFVEFEASDKCLSRRLQNTRGYPLVYWEELHKKMMTNFEPVSSDEGNVIRIVECNNTLYSKT